MGGVWVLLTEKEKRPCLADRLARPLRECKGKEESRPERGERDECGGPETHQNALCPSEEEEGSCSSLLRHTSGQMTRKRVITQPVCKYHDKVTSGFNKAFIYISVVDANAFI